MTDDSDPKPKRPSSAVPSGRLGRFLGLGATAGRMALGGATEAVSRLAKRAEAELPHALLTAKNARLLAARLARLRGAAMKVGQMLSLEGDNLLPAEFAAALEVLRSSAHRMPEKQVDEVLMRAFGPGFRDRFAAFDREPIAAASIGQVHRARTHEGDELALKIQYPGVAESIDSDVDNLRSLLALTRLVPTGLDLDALTEEVKAELRREVDYERELAELEAYRACLGDRPGVRVPRAFREHSSARVLALELVPGVPLLDWAKSASVERRDRVGELLFRLLLDELFVFRLMQTDPNPANYLYDDAQGDLVLLDFGATREVSEATSALYRRAFRGLALRDRALLGSVLDELGIRATEAPEAYAILIDLSLEAAEALDGGPFDFRATNLSERLNTRGKELARYQRNLRPPPPEYLFFQRKLGGTFLLLRQLGARVDCRRVLVEAQIVDA